MRRYFREFAEKENSKPSLLWWKNILRVMPSFFITLIFLKFSKDSSVFASSKNLPFNSACRQSFEVPTRPTFQLRQQSRGGGREDKCFVLQPSVASLKPQVQGEGFIGT